MTVMCLFYSLPKYTTNSSHFRVRPEHQSVSEFIVRWLLHHRADEHSWQTAGRSRISAEGPPRQSPLLPTVHRRSLPCIIQSRHHRRSVRDSGTVELPALPDWAFFQVGLTLFRPTLILWHRYLHHYSLTRLVGPFSVYTLLIGFYLTNSYASAVLGVVILSVRLSVFSSATRMLCDETKTMHCWLTLVFWHQQWLVGDAHFPLKFALTVTHPLRKTPTSTDFRL